MPSPMVSVGKFNCRKDRALAMVRSVKLNPQDHQALQSGLTTLHMRRLGTRKNFIKWV